MDIRIIDTDTLISINKVAYEGDLNRAINPEWLKDNIDPDGIHVISLIMLHNDEQECRCQVLIKTKGNVDPEPAWLDVPIEIFYALPIKAEPLLLQPGR